MSLTKLLCLSVIPLFLAVVSEVALGCETGSESLASPSSGIEVMFCLKDGAPLFSVRENGRQVRADTSLIRSFRESEFNGARRHDSREEQQVCH